MDDAAGSCSPLPNWRRGRILDDAAGSCSPGFTVKVGCLRQACTTVSWIKPLVEMSPVE